MNWTRLLTTDRPSTPADRADPVGPGGGVEGNARLTGGAGAALFLILAVEAVTLLQVKQLISVHVFVGMLLVPLVLLKTSTTGYRFAHYYRGDPPYQRKGPPHPILRITGPFLVASSLVLLGTGIALIALGRTVGHQYLWLHQATFLAWAALIAVHTLGHLRETATLTAADWQERNLRGDTEHRVAGARARLSLLAVTLAVGTALGIASLGWIGTWHHIGDFGHG
ncbi:MAG TPA: hypothetical protein VLV81_10665 [Acidimicrobiia bacterium]|nr:hypothetical protein [Acidimicrobiia bacterium]